MVYVDVLRGHGWRLGPSCHLVADTIEELCDFAARIGMRENWLQWSKKGVPHFDLTAVRRRRAVRAGASEDAAAFLGCVKKWKGVRKTQ